MRPLAPLVSFASVLCLGAMLAGCAGTRPSPEPYAWQSALIGALVERGDADSLWLASLAGSSMRRAHEAASPESVATTAPDPRPTALGLIERAAALAPGDELIAYTRVRICAATAGCDLDAVVRRYRELAPEDGLGWLDAVDRAAAGGDPEEVDAALVRLAGASRFRLGWNSALVRGSTALHPVEHTLPGHDPRFPVTERLSTVAGLTVAVLAPEIAPLSTACRDAAARPARIDACRAIARTLATGDVLLFEGVGLSMQLRQWPEGSPEHAALREARRVFDWRMQQHLPATIPRWPWSIERRSREIASLQAQLPSEQAVMLELMRRHDLPTEPPADWRRVAR